jgi:DNA polymerase-3 subunit epsilon
MDLAEALAVVEASPNHRVLRRIKPPSRPALAGAPSHIGLYVDVETTGLDHTKDEVIELAAIPFDYYDDGTIFGTGVPFHAYSQPRSPISPEITKLTGITQEMVAGKRIDVGELAAFIEGFGLVIAHNAAFDRPFLEAVCPWFTTAPWACSMTQVPWDEHGISGRKLDYVVASLGAFYDAHNAVSDCQAGIYALAATLPTGRTALSYLLERAFLDSKRVWAIGAPFEMKDALKARGYQWNGGEDGRPKAWHREIAADAVEAEVAYLKSDIYRSNGSTGGRISTVTPRGRFTVRG